MRMRMIVRPPRSLGLAYSEHQESEKSTGAAAGEDS